jgi:hypothetical protein
MAGITSKDAPLAQMTNNTELFPAGTSVTETDDAYVIERTFRSSSELLCCLGSPSS